jgi:hypothetical protein
VAGSKIVNRIIIITGSKMVGGAIKQASGKINKIINK